MEQQNQIVKSSQMQLQAKLVKTLDLSKSIISGSAQLPMIEMSLTIKNTLDYHLSGVFLKMKMEQLDMQ